MNSKRKKKYKHGKYVLDHSKGLYIFETRIMKGRFIRKDGKAKDFTFKSHPDLVRTILKKGYRAPAISKEEAKL